MNNEIRILVVDNDLNVWVATAGRIFSISVDSCEWDSLINEKDKEPTFLAAMAIDGAVSMGNWSGLYFSK